MQERLGLQRRATTLAHMGDRSSRPQPAACTLFRSRPVHLPPVCAPRNGAALARRIAAEVLAAARARSARNEVVIISAGTPAATHAAGGAGICTRSTGCGGHGVCRGTDLCRGRGPRQWPQSAGEGRPYGWVWLHLGPRCAHIFPGALLKPCSPNPGHQCGRRGNT